MLKQKARIHHIPLALAVFLVVTASSFYALNILAQTTYTVPICAFTYSDWSACSSSGIQTRAINSTMPSGCSGGNPEISRTCTYTAPVCAFTYSDWSACSSSGIQTRAINSTMPSGCSGGNPEISRTCTYTAPITTPTCTSHTCSDWSQCSSSGKQTRACTFYPSGCQGGDTANTSMNCTYIAPITLPTCTSHTCTDWSICNSSGKQTRACVYYPAGCQGGDTASLSMDCTYTAPTTTIICTSHDCSLWSPCDSSGKQTRSCSYFPSGCQGGDTAYTSLDCTYIPPNTTLNCSPSCSSWSGCGQDGYQIRDCTAALGCPRTNWTEKNYCAPSSSSSSGSSSVVQSTTTNTTSAAAVSCVDQCSSWSDCNSNGYHSRTCQKPSETACVAYEDKQSCVYSTSSFPSEVNSIVPTNCSSMCSLWSVCSPAGIKNQSCWPTPAGCPGENKTVTQNCVPTLCKFNYSEWGACTSGYQYRFILNNYPQGCVGGNPELMKECVATETNSSGSAAVPETPAIVSAAPIDPDNSVNVKWKKDNFKTDNCPDQICGGNADPDKDGLSNNDEFRYGTDPMNPDTDHDGKTDGEEVAAGTDPLKSSAKGEADAITYESPKTAGTVKTDVYKVTNVEMSQLRGDVKQLKITGKGPADSYINIYIYSGDPIIVTVKTDSNGDWTYNVDRELDNGNHEVYVAVTNNSGAIKAKSNPLPFVKTAQAVEVAQASENKNNVIQPASKEGISLKNILYIFAFGFAAVVLALILIGMVIKKVVSKRNTD